MDRKQVGYYSCRAHDVTVHWSRRGRPRVTEEPGKPSVMQLELNTTGR